jgi:Fe2+ or Zn2+ uptake regulation protein
VAKQEAIVRAFDEAGYRLTEPRRALAQLVAEQRGHFTADHLVATSRARRLGVGRATVFRSLEILAELGLVERLDLPSGEHAFVACEPSHHHHVVCSRCGRSTDVGDSGMSRVIDEVARRSGYRIDVHRLELFGLCRECQANAASVRDGESTLVGNHG